MLISLSFPIECKRTKIIVLKYPAHLLWFLVHSKHSTYVEILNWNGRPCHIKKNNVFKCFWQIFHNVFHFKIFSNCNKTMKKLPKLAIPIHIWYVCIFNLYYTLGFFLNLKCYLFYRCYLSLTFQSNMHFNIERYLYKLSSWWFQLRVIKGWGTQ